jgi:hypothetical protein
LAGVGSVDIDNSEEETAQIPRTMK